MGGETPSEAWFVAQIKPNCERLSERNLVRQGFQTFRPVHEETRRRGSKFVPALRPLFPGYLFIAFDPADGRWRAVNSTYGVARLVSFGSAPARVPDALVWGLLRRCDRSGKLLRPGEVNPGDRVRIATGPFAGFAASVESFAPNMRLRLLLELMGQARHAEVPAAALRATCAP
jgi:transcriptional antiterminator RfaH